MKFLSPEIAHLYKSTICLCWAVTPSAKMDMQDCCSFTCCLSWTLGSLLKCCQLKTSIGISLVDAHLSWLNWFHFLILEEGQLVILIDCMILLSPFLDLTRMSTSKVSFLAQIDSGFPVYRILSFDLWSKWL